MNTFSLLIKTDNAAFSDGNACWEIARILRELADKVERGEADENMDGFSIVLMDVNGNRVGEAEAICDEDEEEEEEQEHCRFYQVEMDFLPPETPVECGACDWKGTYAEVEEIDECCLTPGDPSPAGRCPHPKCVGSLVYVIKEVDHATPES